MSVYMTEAEQLAILKKWWQRYQLPITIVVSMFLLCFSGVKYWNMHKAKVQQQASVAYENMMASLARHDSKSLHAYANQLITSHRGTVYADTAQLTLAKWYVQKKKYELARKALHQVIQHTHIAALSDIARIRMARIYLAEKSYDEALNQLLQISNSLYMPLINQIRGDIFAAKGQTAQARIYYHKAWDEFKANDINNVFLEMTMNEYE